MTDQDVQTTDNEPLESQVDRLANVLMDEFGGPTRSESAIDMAIRLLRENATPDWVTAVHIDLLGDDSFNFEGGWTEYGTVQSGDGDTIADAVRNALEAA